MNSYCFVLKFTTPIGTPLKGDTLFGHICWQIAYDKSLFNKTINDLISEYHSDPFCVVSSGFPIIKQNDKYTLLFRSSSLPHEVIFSEHIKEVHTYLKERKKFKKKRWMVLEGTSGSLKKARYYTDKEVFELLLGLESEGVIREFTYVHNSIQRTTLTTSSEGFAPYSVYNYCYHPDLYTGVVVCTIEEYLTPTEKVLKRIGQTGFGRDASAGLGKFDVIEYFPLDIYSIGAKEPDAIYTLSPAVIEPKDFVESYYIPFVRYGKHGDILAKTRNPFKNPIIMLDEGAVLVLKNREVLKKPYTGKALKGVSIVLEQSIHQGYTPYIPVLLEDKSD